MDQIIGREEEIEIIERLYSSSSSEFLAVYGRRRVGKTFLITKLFQGRGIFFQITGSPTASVQEHLRRFHLEFCALFKSEETSKSPKNWSEAFHRLKNALENIKPSQKVVIFLDELPWLASSRSNFLPSLDHFWNRYVSFMPNVFLIVCGSSASWMIQQVLNNKGGLYGRLSAHLRLRPYTLLETERYLISRGVHLPRTQICEIYMVTGGIPKYLSLVTPGKSAAQNIHSLCFTPQSPLLTEFHKLYHSLFSSPEHHVAIVKALAKSRKGLLRNEVLKMANLQYSGRTSQYFRELEESDFIMTIPGPKKQVRESLVLLIDEYSLFYLNWIDSIKGQLLQGVDKDYWTKRHNSQEWRSWAGFAFESICLKHVDWIKKALGIGGVTTNTYYWKSLREGKKEIEVDLVIDRADNCINLCEIKFRNAPYVLSKSYANELNFKRELFIEKSKTKKAVFNTLITSYGATKNAPYLSCIDNQITIDSFFKI